MSLSLVGQEAPYPFGWCGASPIPAYRWTKGRPLPHTGYMPTTTKSRTCYHVPADQLTEGQVLRDFYGRTLTVANLRASTAHNRVSFDLTDAGDGTAVTLTLEGHRTMVTWSAAELPGLDPATCRCATCDSRGCGLICARPWVTDRA